MWLEGTSVSSLQSHSSFQKHSSLLLWNRKSSMNFCCSVTQFCPTHCDPIDCNTPGFPIHHHLPELAQTHFHWVNDAIQPSHPVSSPSPAFDLSQHQGVLNESVLHIRWPNYQSFSFNISPSSEYTGLISFRMDWLDLLAAQGTLKSLLPTTHFKSINLLALSLLYGPTLHIHTWHWKNHRFDYVDLCQQVMSLLFNMLSRLVIAFLPRSKHLLISWLQSPFTVIWEPKKIKSHCFHCFPIYLSWSDGTGYHDLRFLNVEFKPAFSCSSFTFIKRLFSSFLLSTIRLMSSAYLRLLIFLPAILIPACASSSWAFLRMYSAYKLNKQGNNIQPWRSPFPIWSQSIVLCLVLMLLMDLHPDFAGGS